MCFYNSSTDCDAMLQYWQPNFSVVLRLNCIFVIDVAVKQLSRSFLKCNVSAVTMTANNFFLKSNQILVVFVSLNSL